MVNISPVIKGKDTLYLYPPYISHSSLVESIAKGFGGEMTPLDAFKKGKKYVLITRFNFNVNDFLRVLRQKGVVIVGVMEQNADYRFLIRELNGVGLRVDEVFEEIITLNPKDDTGDFREKSAIVRAEREYNSLNIDLKNNLRFLFDLVVFGVYEGKYKIKRDWFGEVKGLEGFLDVEGDYIVPKVDKLYAIFQEDWGLERFLSVIKRLPDNYEPFNLLARSIHERVYYLDIKSEEMRKAFELTLNWAINLSKGTDGFLEAFEKLAYYRISFPFDENLQIGIKDIGDFLKDWLGKLDLELELRIKNVLALMHLYSGNYNHAKVLFEEIIKRDDGYMRDMALLNLAFLKGRMGKIFEEYEMFKSIINRGSQNKKVILLAISNMLSALVQLYNKTGDSMYIQEAKLYFQKGLRILEGFRDNHGMFHLRYNYAIIMSNIGEYEEALRRVEEILRVYNKEINPNEYADTLGLKGYILLLMDEYERARETFEEALETFDLSFKNFENRYCIAKIYYAKTLSKLGRVGEAVEIMLSVKGKAEEVGYTEIWKNVMSEIQSNTSS
ncbi:MAG: tetratricopeptide repeat protein [candidate division WOR-3 bacterium]